MAIQYPQGYDDDFINTIKKLIDHVNEYGKTLQELVVDGQLTEEQYSNLITTVNGMIKSGDVDKSDLTPDLRAEVDKVRNKIDKGEVSIYDINKNKGKFDQTYLTQDLIDAITGAPGANILSEVAYDSITSDKVTKNGIDIEATDFIQPSQNLLNPEKFVPNKTLDIDGSLMDSSLYTATGFIRAKGNTQYSMNVSNNTRVVFLDHNMEPINNGWTNNIGQTFTSPSGTRFIRLAISNNVIDTAQLSESSEPLPFENYGGKLKELVEVPKPKITVEDLNITKKSSNLYNKDATNKSAYLNIDGELVNSTTYAVSDYIAIDSTKKYAKKYGTNVSFFDEDKNFISRNTMTGTVITPVPNSKYMRININQEDVESQQVNEGEALLPYEEYYYWLDNRFVAPSTENNGGTTPVNSARKFIPFHEEGLYVADTQDYLDIEDANTMIQNFRDLASENPDFLTEEYMGDDESGTYPIYKYKWSPPRVTHSQLSHKLPKIVITGGLHGTERSAVLALYYTIKRMAEDYHKHPVLEYLHSNIELAFVPLANPYGYQNYTRQNSNGVDINRNFSAQWEANDPSAYNYSGPSAGSEVETQYLMEFVDDNTDGHYFLDCHTHGSSGETDRSQLIWSALNEPPNLDDTMMLMSSDFIGRMTRMFIKEHGLPDDEGYFGYMTTATTGGTSKVYAAEQGLKAQTFEVLKKLPEHSTNFEEQTNRMATEIFVNWLAQIVKYYQ